jgi:hypothetical protein
VGINHINYEASNNLYDGNIVYSVMLCVRMCLGAVKIVARATQLVQFSIGNAQGRKDWIDATISELDRLTGRLGNDRYSGIALALWSLVSPPVASARGWRCLQDGVVIDFPAQTVWTLQNSAGTLVVGQSTGSLIIEGGAVSKTAFIVEGSNTYEMTYT